MLLTDFGVAKCPASGAAGARTAVAPDPVGDGRTGGVTVSVLTTYTHTYTHITGRLHVPIVGPTSRSDWSVRLVGPTIVSCKRFVRPVGQTVGRIKHV